MHEVTINETVHSFEPGLTILQALNRIGVVLPSLCHDPRVRPGGNCRLCSVEIDGEAHSAAACVRKVAPGMRIQTHTPALEAFRRSMLELLAGRCSPESFVELPEKELHRWMTHYGIGPGAYSQSSEGIDESHPHFRFDPAQCIACSRCVRVCEELQGQFVWHVLGRGESDHLAVDKSSLLIDSSCVGCGACVDACPSAALVDSTRLQRGAATSWTRTTCGYCGVGCEMQVGVREGRIVQVLPDRQAPVSRGHLCSKGRYAWAFGEASDRVVRPLVRSGRTWKVVEWNEALDRAVAEIERVRSAYGPDSIGVLGSARATNEENYLTQKLARLAIGTNNVDCCARVCHAPTAAAMKHMLGTGAATNSFEDIEHSRTILVAGANPTENHPIIGARIKQQVRRGARLIVIDPRRIELAEWADVHLAPKPGTNIPLLNAIAQVIIQEELCDPDFVRSRIDGFDAFAEHVRAFSPEAAADLCGVSADAIRAAARLYATQKPAMCFHGLGMTEHLQGTEGVMALVNLALLTGNIGRRGAGINPLRGQNNVQGAAVMGCEPDTLTGSTPIEQGRARFESVWGAAIPTQRGLNLMGMMDAAAEGRLKALYVIGYDVLLTLAKTSDIRAALGRVETVIVQDFVMNETAREFGTVFLPVATNFEKSGTFMNAERRIQRVRQVLQPPDQARTDAWIVGQIADRLGHGTAFDLPDAESVWNEIRAVWPAVAGISYARIDEVGMQWPCPSSGHPGTTILHGDSFAGRQRARLECVDFIPTEERASEEYPWLLTTGRNLYQFNAGTMTARTPNAVLRAHDTLDISPDDAVRLQAENGTKLLVTSRHGSVTLPARIDHRVKAGQLFATFHDPQQFVNAVTGDVRDRRVGAPQYKVTCVRIEIDQEAEGRTRATH
jgi:formate dehydrogenase major subunit